MNTFKDVIDKLKPAFYNWKKDDSKKKSFGFIAQDLLEYFPEDKYDIVQKQSNGFYAVQYHQLIPILVSEIQDLRKRVVKLEEMCNETSHFISNK